MWVGVGVKGDVGERKNERGNNMDYLFPSSPNPSQTLTHCGLYLRLLVRIN